MAVVWVRNSTKGSTAGADSITSSFAALPAAGNAIVVTCWAFSSNAFATGNVTDNQGNTYTFIEERANVSGDARAATYYALNIGAPSGTFTVTLNMSGASDAMVVGSAEFSGVAVTGALDQHTTGQGTSAAPSTGTTASTSQADEVAVGTVEIGTNGPYVTPSGWSQIIEEDDNSGIQGGESVYQILSAVGTPAATWSTGSVGWSGCIATFKGEGSTAIRVNTPTWPFPHPPMRTA